MTVWAFSDESERGSLMLMAIVYVAPGQADEVRAAMRSLLLPGERRLHTAKESPRRRRVLLDAVSRLEVTASVLRYRRSFGVRHPAARRVLLESAVSAIVGAPAESWTLDDMSPAERSNDRNVIGHELARLDARQLLFDHRRSEGEPLLWVADAVCWAVGAGGDWRRRVERIVTVTDIRP